LKRRFKLLEGASSFIHPSQRSASSGNFDLTKFLLLKIASKIKNANERSAEIEAELSSPNGIAKRWVGDR
jgi:hypothetical protein